MTTFSRATLLKDRLMSPEIHLRGTQIISMSKQKSGFDTFGFYRYNRQI
jgi:hypothetical protein